MEFVPNNLEQILKKFQKSSIFVLHRVATWSLSRRPVTFKQSNRPHCFIQGLKISKYFVISIVKNCFPIYFKQVTLGGDDPYKFYTSVSFRLQYTPCNGCKSTQPPVF